MGWGQMEALLETLCQTSMIKDSAARVDIPSQDRVGILRQDRVVDTQSQHT